jgi:hypothetical protein
MAMREPESSRNDHIKKQRRRADGRVESAYSDADLYEIVARAARHAKAHAPETLSLREFDRTLTAVGFPDAPSARAIYGRLKKPWWEIVETALKPRSEQEMVEKIKARSAEASWIGARHVFYAINTLCIFKEVETLDERDYDRYRTDYLDHHSRGEIDRERLEDLLPTSGQILNFIAKHPVEGTSLSTPAWSKALLFAGRAIYAQTRTAGMPLQQAIDLYIEATGSKFIPSHREIVRLASEWDVSVEGRQLGKSWDSYLAEVTATRAERGLTTPTELPETKTPPELPRPTGLVARAQMPRGNWKDEKNVIEALTPFVLHCQAEGEPPTRGRYLSWRKSCPDQAPAPSTIERYRVFSDWIHIVQDRLLEAKKAA